MNYHHLLYFWTVAREGGVTRAAERLNVTQPSITRQLQSLEGDLGIRLFEKSGRTLQLTEAGRLVYDYADEIFALGRELRDAVKSGLEPKRIRLAVGVADVVPKLIAYRLLAPALKLGPALQLVADEDEPARLLARLALHELDLVISDAPIGHAAKVRGFNHLLGESDVAFFAPSSLRLTGRFPRSLDGAPMLLPTRGTELRRALDHWFESKAVHPRIVAEFADSALMSSFAHEAVAIFPGPQVVRAEIERQYGVAEIGATAEVRERYYAISGERRIKNPAVAAITEAAKEMLR